MIEKQSDLIHIYKLGNDSFVKLARLNYTTLSLNNFEKQKVSLAMNIFNEKTIWALELNDKKDTAVFVSAVTQLWNCLNIKTKDGWVLPNDKKGEPFSSIDDPGFEKMFKLAEEFKHMNVLESTYSDHGHVSYVQYQKWIKCDFNRTFKQWF